MATPIASIDATGIHRPDFAAELGYFTGKFQDIFGADIYLGNDSQDGQFVGLLALALDDVNSGIVAAYNCFSPSTAQGTGLSSVVKINGIARSVPTKSTVDLSLTGNMGTVIENGVVEDTSGNKWTLPASVTIPASGLAIVTATAVLDGAFAAPAGTVTTIVTRVLGWQTVTNNSPAIIGSPVETDAHLRDRQALSTSLPSVTVVEGVIGALLALPGVVRAVAHENDTNLIDAKGIPAHGISFVVDGGEANDIAQTIALKKTPGIGTFGTTVKQVSDAYGITRNVAFYRPSRIDISFAIVITALPGYTVDIEEAIRLSLIEWVNAREIGAPLYLSRAYLPIQLNGAPASKYFDLESVAMARDGLVPVAQDIEFLFHEVPYTQSNFITVTVLLA